MHHDITPPGTHQAYPNLWRYIQSKVCFTKEDVQKKRSHVPQHAIPEPSTLYPK